MSSASASNREELKCEYEAHLQKFKRERPFPCPHELCFKRFKNKQGLYNHKRTHTKPFQCEECKEKFGQKSQLKAHMRHHTGEKIYGPCSICRQMWFNASDIVNYTDYYKRSVKYGWREPLKDLVCFCCYFCCVRYSSQQGR